MNALNVMCLLNDIDCNTNVDIQYCRNKSEDCIYIETKNFKFSIGEYGSCVLYWNGIVGKQEDVLLYERVKNWVVKYFSEVV